MTCLRNGTGLTMFQTIADCAGASHERTSPWTGQLFHEPAALIDHTGNGFLQAAQQMFPHESVEDLVDVLAVAQYQRGAFMYWTSLLFNKFRGRGIPTELALPFKLVASGINRLAASAAVQQRAPLTVYRGVMYGRGTNCSAFDKQPRNFTSSALIPEFGFLSTSLSAYFASGWGGMSIQIRRSLRPTYVGTAFEYGQLEEVKPAGSMWQLLACEHLPLGRGGVFGDDLAVSYMVEIDPDVGPMPADERAPFVDELRADLRFNLLSCFAPLCQSVRNQGEGEGVQACVPTRIAQNCTWDNLGTADCPILSKGLNITAVPFASCFHVDEPVPPQLHALLRLPTPTAVAIADRALARVSPSHPLRRDAALRLHSFATKQSPEKRAIEYGARRKAAAVDKLCAKAMEEIRRAQFQI